jgi:CRP/FNR family transcriptional regulator, anaerobic regulatory protein
MPASTHFAYQRPELHESLLRGEQKIRARMSGAEYEHKAAQILVKENSDHPFVYRMLTGWAARIRTLPDGREQCILIFLPGDLFAVKSMLVARHPDSIRVLCSSRMQRIDQRELHAAFLDDPDIANRCIWQVAEEERRLHNWVVGLGQGSAEERMAMLLVDFRGRLADSGAIDSNATSYRMPLTQVQLADHLGITAIHVNRVLRVFRESGLAQVRDGEVSILDLERLAAIARPLLDPYQRSSPHYVGELETVERG